MIDERQTGTRRLSVVDQNVDADEFLLREGNGLVDDTLVAHTPHDRCRFDFDRSQLVSRRHQLTLEQVDQHESSAFLAECESDPATDSSRRPCDDGTPTIQYTHVILSNFGPRTTDLGKRSGVALVSTEPYRFTSPARATPHIVLLGATAMAVVAHA